jgi:tetratricopeptide (TPR) repeat protein
MRPYRFDLPLCVLLAVLTLAAFWPALRGGFVNYDDPDYVTDNPRVQAGLSAANVRWAFRTFHTANWHPLTWLSLQADRTLYGGAGPFGFHLTNLLLHTGSTLLVFLTFRALTGCVWPSALAAALFAVHPLHVESVAWVSERKDVLSTFFWFLSIAAYGWYARRPGVLRYLAVVLAFICGLLAKPMLVTLPCVLLLLDFWPLRRVEWRRAAWLVAEKAPLLALAAVSCWMTWKAQQSGGAVKPLTQYSGAVRLGNAVAAYGGYLQKMVWPKNLAAFYPHPGDGLSVAAVGVSAALLLGVTIACLWAARRHPYAIVGWLWYLGTLVPVIGLVQVGEQAMADRYTYVPLAGVFLALSWATADLARHWPFLRGTLALAAVFVLGVCVQLTWKQSATWVNSHTLWSHAAEKVPNNWLAHINLALDYGGNNPAEAVEHLREAVRIRPDFPLGQLNLGVYLAQLGQKEEAEKCYRAVLESWPRIPQAHSNLGLLLLEKDRLDEARRHLEEAVRLDPGYDRAHYGLGQALVRQGDVSSAVDCFRRAAALRPERASYQYSLASALEEQGATHEARELFREAVRQDASYPGGARKEAWRLATARAVPAGQAAWAVHLARVACHDAEQPDPEALDTLAVALAAAGRFAEATAQAERACAAAEAAGQAAQAARIRERLGLFRACRPYYFDP